MSLWDLFSSSNERQAKDALVTGYQKGEQRASGALGTGFTGLTGDYSSALSELSPYADSGKAASGLYSDALGLNGAEGNARATGAYSASPGYQYGVDQALQALERSASSRGMLAGGGTSSDILNTIYGRANADYGSWLDRLSGQQTLGANAAGSRANILTNEGNARYQYGSDLGNLYNTSELGQAGAQADYLKSKDQTGANILGAVFGGLSLGSKMLGIGGFAPGGS